MSAGDLWMLPADVPRCGGVTSKFGTRPLVEPCRNCRRRTDFLPFDHDRLYTWIAKSPVQLTDNGWQCEMRIAPEGS